MSEMQQFEVNEIRIALYLEDKMTPEEEATFVHDLGEDEGLRQQYEEELQMQALWETREERASGDPDLLLQGADEHIRMVEAALEEKDSARVRRGSKVPVYARWGIAAAAVLVIVVVVDILRPSDKTGLVRQGGEGGRKPADTALAVGPNRVDVKRDSVAGVRRLYARFYKVYSASDVPVEISDYYNDYRDGNYASVLAVKPADYQAMGVGDKHVLLMQYMQLLKGLSYLGLNEAEKADRQFDSVMLTAGAGTARYYEAQWYSVLTWLQRGYTVRVQDAAKVIAASRSPYAGRAGALVDSLGR